MANILEKYGIKEVADVTFYKVENNEAGAPALFLDTLKVSTIDVSAEEADARGGKGNPTLIIWDYGKDITATLEDALFSAKSMAVMFGNGAVATESTGTLRKTITWTGSTAPTFFEGPQGKTYTISGATHYDGTGASVTSFKSGEHYYSTFDISVKDIQTIEISEKTFPGVYYMTGDTYARSRDGVDEFFQFIIPRAKIQPTNTITLEADGDPTVFNLNIRVIKGAGLPMMKLVKYDMTEISG